MKTIVLTAKKINLVMLTDLLMLTLVTAALFMLLGANASADVAGAITSVKNQATLIVPPLGTVAIIALGIAAMFGRITWTQALVVAIGIVIAANAGSIYNDIAR